MSSMQVSSGRPHMLTSYQRGRGKDPVVVLGRIKLAVAVNMASRLTQSWKGHFESAGLPQQAQYQENESRTSVGSRNYDLHRVRSAGLDNVKYR